MPLKLHQKTRSSILYLESCTTFTSMRKALLNIITCNSDTVTLNRWPIAAAQGRRPQAHAVTLDTMRNATFGVSIVHTILHRTMGTRRDRSTMEDRYQLLDCNFVTRLIKILVSQFVLSMTKNGWFWQSFRLGYEYTFARLKAFSFNCSIFIAYCHF